jgi:hypothetical protein
VIDQVRKEIEELHAFFVRWFNGTCPEDDGVFAAGVLDHLAPSFTLIPPAGTILDRTALATAIRASHGSSPDFAIEIRAIQIRVGEIRARAGDLIVATYEEWQRAAAYSTPPENGRIATALLRVRGQDEHRADCLEWLHVHETWLPAEVMARGPYDF